MAVRRFSFNDMIYYIDQKGVLFGHSATFARRDKCIHILICYKGEMKFILLFIDNIIIMLSVSIRTSQNEWANMKFLLSFNTFPYKLKNYCQLPKKTRCSKIVIFR